MPSASHSSSVVRSSSLLASVVASTLVPCIAAEAATTPSTVAAEDPALANFVVTATRIATPALEVLAPVVVIDRDTIERSAAIDAADLLRFHAGIDVARTGGFGQPTSVFIRGADSNHTLVLVDGVRINPGTIGLPALQNVMPDMIERIEVVKGPRSALWGTDAIGGVVNLVTRRGSRDGWAVEAGYGDYDTRRASLNGGTGLGSKASLDFGVSWLDSAGFPTRTEDATDRGFESLDGNVRLQAEIGAAEVSLQHWRAEGNSEYSDYFLAPVDQDFETATTAVEVRAPLGARGQGRLAISRLEDDIEQNQSPDFLRTRRDTVEAQYDRTLDDVHTLGLGVMHYRENALSESYGTRFDAETDSTGLYLQDSIVHGPHLALLALGYTDHETAGSAVTWNLEYGYTFNAARTRVFGLAGSGFRAPDATDRYGYGGNPDLEPEQSRNYELGVRHALTERQTLTLSAFQTDIDDLIEFVVTDFETFEGINRNVAEARIRGVEAGWRYAGDLWQAHVEAIYQQPRNLADDSTLLRRAERSLTAGVTRSYGPVQLGLDVLASGERKDVGFPQPVTLDSYVLANLTAQWQVTPSLALVARVENLLDEQYELANTYNTPDRGLYVTVRYAPPTKTTAAVAQAASLQR
ncbi:MAG TPA: TonB-dependent receptor [Steroidobacteraceae bacterium]|nr:TonB-dependent receptor [Steroidobacteraceae bacterium]